MTKHQTVIISFADFENRIFSDSDDFTAADALDVDASDWVRADYADKWILASWPEHVGSPRYNSDGSYSEFDTLEDAQAYDPDAAVFIG